MSPGRAPSTQGPTKSLPVANQRGSINDAWAVKIKRALGESSNDQFQSSSDELADEDEDVRSSAGPRKKARNLDRDSVWEIRSTNGDSHRNLPGPLPLSQNSRLTNVETNKCTDISSSTIQASLSPPAGERPPETDSQEALSLPAIKQERYQQQSRDIDVHTNGTKHGLDVTNSDDEIAHKRVDWKESRGQLVLPELAEPERHSDGFLPGSIVRLAVQNFITYDATEFFPGPYLNMIIGPNGTGKSTIVCAIALGLGWKPAVLGRAKDIASYVKQGCDEGWIEIELKGFIGEENVVIRRSIHRKDNTSEYRLNNKKVTAKEVNDKVAEFDVNVDNLCCFLPQDKVADFARMDPARLLVETEHAAGDPNLSKWHDNLNILGTNCRELRDKLKEDQQEQAHLEQRNQTLSRDVERYEQRRRLEDEIAQLNLQVPVAEYEEARGIYTEKRNVRDRCKKELEQLKRLNRPLEDKVTLMKQQRSALEASRSRLDDKVRKINRDLKKHCADIDRFDNDTQELHSSVETLKDREKQRQALIYKLRKEVESLEAQVSEEPEDVDTSSIESAIREVRWAICQIEQHCTDIQGSIDDIGQETRSLHSIKDETLGRLQGLDSARNAKLQMLSQADPAAVKAIQWLRANQTRFQKKVFEPVMLELSVKDNRFSTYIEGCINWIQMRTFVCQTRADYDVFTHELIDNQKLRLNVSELEGGRTVRQSEQQRPYQLEQIKRMGFDDFASNLVDVPEPILAWLYSAAGLHLVPVAFQDTVNLEQVENTRMIKKYIANGAIHTVQFSEYGRRLPQTMSRDLRPARTLGQSVNMAEKQRLEGVMKDVAEKLQEAEERVGRLQEEMSTEKEKITEKQARKRELDGQRIDALRGRREWEKCKIELEQKRRRLDQELRKPSIEAEKKRIENSLRLKAKERMDVVSSIKDVTAALVVARAELDIALLVQLSHVAEYEAWRDYLQTKDSDYDAAKLRLQDALEDFQEAKDKATRLGKQAQARLDAAPEEVLKQFQDEQAARQASGETLPSLAELQSLMLEKQGALEMAAGIAPGVIESFKKRAAQIRTLEESIVTRQRQLVKMDAKVEKIRGKWYPSLKALVERVSHRFSVAFGRIGCAGEVRISEHQDHYEKWGIDILVKFRDKEQLQLLTSQRQSGGERSLSTVLYLMSLTELSRSPFSLVDEINQGMDQRAERAVHDQMVEVTCRPHASQYFLITPKLLSDLRYHEKMKVLIINNGEWLPEKLDLGSIARAALARRGQEPSMPWPRAPAIAA